MIGVAQCPFVLVVPIRRVSPQIQAFVVQLFDGVSAVILFHGGKSHNFNALLGLIWGMETEPLKFAG